MCTITMLLYALAFVALQHCCVFCHMAGPEFGEEWSIRPTEITSVMNTKEYHYYNLPLCIPDIAKNDVCFSIILI